MLNAPSPGEGIGDLDHKVSALVARYSEAESMYAGWEMRVYIDDAFTEHFVKALASQHIRPVRMSPYSAGSPVWFREGQRLRVMDDEEVDVFMLRDVQSPLTAREAISVMVWLTSGASFLSLHNRPEHTGELLAGTWGGRRAAVGKAFGGRSAAELLDAALAKGPTAYTSASDLMSKELWPAVEPFTLRFDSHQSGCKHDGKLCVPFPMETPESGLSIGVPAGPTSYVRNTLNDISCSNLVSALAGVRVLKHDQFNSQWTGTAWPHMKKMCA